MSFCMASSGRVGSGGSGRALVPFHSIAQVIHFRGRRQRVGSCRGHWSFDGDRTRRWMLKEVLTASALGKLLELLPRAPAHGQSCSFGGSLAKHSPKRRFVVTARRAPLCREAPRIIKMKFTEVTVGYCSQTCASNSQHLHNFVAHHSARCSQAMQTR